MTTYAIVLVDANGHEDELFFNDEATRDDYARTATNEYRDGYLGSNVSCDPASDIDYAIIATETWIESFDLNDCEDFEVVA